jgi:hypothetical protein
VLQIAHDIGFPHQEPAQPVILVSLVAVGGLIWLKRRVDD